MKAKAFVKDAALEVAGFLLILVPEYVQGTGGRSEVRGALWIDPNKEEPAGTHYRLFPTPSRGTGTQASYLVYLPPDYESAASRRCPVLYWLHGGAGASVKGDGWSGALTRPFGPVRSRRSS